MKTGVKASDAMTEKPITLSPDSNVQECAALMDKEHVGAILIKEDNHVRGIITEQDIVRKLVAKGENPLEKKLEEVMEKELITANPSIDIFDALIIMRDENIRHLPIVDDGNFLGLLTLKDILKLQPQLFDLLLEKFEIREAERKLWVD